MPTLMEIFCGGDEKLGPGALEDHYGRPVETDPEALIYPDAVGDIHIQYRHLKLGLVYGARWSD